MALQELVELRAVAPGEAGGLGDAALGELHQAREVVALEAGRDGLRVARDRYKEGVLSSSDLLDAETRLLRAELDATLTEARIQIALANLNRAVGR